MIEVKAELDRIKHYLKTEFYDIVIKESAGIFETIFKYIYKQAFADFSLEQRNELLEAERDIGKGKCGFDQFGFGQFVGLFARTKLLDKWSKIRGKTLGILNAVSLSPIVDIRNNLVHEEIKIVVNEHMAKLVYEVLMNWLVFIGYEEKPIKEEVIEVKPEVVKQTEEKKPEDHLNDKIKSTYTASTSVERKRLVVQASLCDEIDKDSFEYAIKKIGKTKDLIGLDIGCATGYVTESRFKKEYGFAKVLGLDKDENVIQPDHDYFTYRQLNVEGEDFDDQIEELMEKLDIPAFDIVYMSFSLHHLTTPVKFLKRIRKVMSKGGVILLKGVDDGAQLAYSDNGLVKEVVDDFLKLEGISDRLHARKFYSQLKSAGFNEVAMKYQVTNTVGLCADDKEAIYNYYFGFRKYYSKRLVEKYPEDVKHQERHDQFVDKVERLEEIFLKPDLYYHVLLVCAIGVKE